MSKKTRQVKQCLLLIFCSLLVFLLFQFGNTRTPVEEALKKMQQATKTEETTEIDFEEVLATYKAKLPPDQLDSIKVYEKQLEQTTSSTLNASYKKLADFWEKNLGFGPQAYYLEKIANIDSQPDNYLASGNQYFIAARVSRDSVLRIHYTNQAEALFEKVLEADPENATAKVQLGKTLVDLKNEVMRGVFMLREVVEKDSTHVEANLTLGRLAIFSQQHNKAISRLNNVILQDSKNTEALYYLGEAYVGLGNTDKALVYFKQCLALSENPQFKKELENYINNLITRP